MGQGRVEGKSHDRKGVMISRVDGVFLEGSRKVFGGQDGDLLKSSLTATAWCATVGYKWL